VELGASGAGPGNGLFEPGTWTLGKSPKWSARQFGPLATSFERERAKSPIRGAMPICEFGCGIVGLLVTAGPERGRIWIGKRSESNGLVSEEDLDFADWIERWLAEAEERSVASPDRPRPHPNAAATWIDASDLATKAELGALVRDVTARVEATGKAAFGKLGAFVRRGPRIYFDQGHALRAALATTTPLPEVGVLTRVFQALLAAPAWTGVEVPGLFRAWVREEAEVTMRDYLGRTVVVQRAERGFTVETTLAQ
jgi:hypothetical protein